MQTSLSVNGVNFGYEYFFPTFFFFASEAEMSLRDQSQVLMGPAFLLALSVLTFVYGLILFTFN